MEPNPNTPDPFEFNPADHDSAGQPAPAGSKKFPAAPAPIHGIAGILDLIPRDVPDGMWASILLPDGSGAEHAQMSEVGVVVRRETIAASLDRVGLKMASTDIDALLVATGYALSAVTAHLIVGAVQFAEAQKVVPPEVRESFAETARRMGTLDDRLAPVFRLINNLTAEGSDPAERRARDTRNEIMAGSTIMGTLVRTDGHLIAVGSAIALAATARLAHELGGRLEEGEANDGSSE
jgi:hypothetical protein